MRTLTRPAPAKLNLTLDVLGKREDGYHEMKMVMTSVSLADAVTLTSEPGEGVALSSNLGFLPVDGKNLAVSAALRLKEAAGADWGRLTIALEKKVPVCAGMAGGSSDAAAVLVGLNELLGLGLTTGQLMEIGTKVGSDVPYCVLGSTALAQASTAGAAAGSARSPGPGRCSLGNSGPARSPSATITGRPDTGSVRVFPVSTRAVKETDLSRRISFMSTNSPSDALCRASR